MWMQRVPRGPLPRGGCESVHQGLGVVAPGARWGRGSSLAVVWTNNFCFVYTCGCIIRTDKMFLTNTGNVTRGRMDSIVARRELVVFFSTQTNSLPVKIK